MISGRPSRYQVGWVLYIGGETRNETSGFSSLALCTIEQNSVRMGSARWDTGDEEASRRLVKKLVMQDKTQTFDSALSCDKASAKISMWPQGTNWAAFINGFERQLTLFRWRPIFESPMMVKQRDILKSENPDPEDLDLRPSIFELRYPNLSREKFSVFNNNSFFLNNSSFWFLFLANNLMRVWRCYVTIGRRWRKNLWVR